MLEPSLLFEIHRLHHEGVSQRAISRQLGLNVKTVRKYLKNPRLERSKQTANPSILDPYKNQIHQWLSVGPRGERNGYFSIA